MTKQQKARLLRIARNDCFCASSYKHGNMTCIIGAMVVATHKPQSKVYRTMLQFQGDGISADHLSELSDALCQKFGLRPEQLSTLQHNNDRVDNDLCWPEKPNSPENVAERRRKVIKAIRSFPVERRRK